MAAKKRTARKKRSWGWKVALALLVLLALCLGGLYATARVVHVRYATVYLRGLPPAFEGTTLLFVSDIDAHSAQDARAAAAMMDTLAALRPDVLLLGGDYAAPGFWEGLNGMGVDDPAVAADAAANRYLFLSSLADFPAPLGKFAVLGERDCASEEIRTQISDLLSEADFEILNNRSLHIRNGTNSGIVLIGVEPLLGGTPDVTTATSQISDEEYNILVTHCPDLFAQDGIPYTSISLGIAGHSHGAQINLPLLGPYQSSEGAKQYPLGKYQINTMELQVSSGVGTTGVNARLFSSSEIVLYRLQHTE